MAKSDSQWDQRILCSDGNCIGIIGAEGRCKVCGLPYDGELPSPVADSAEADDDVDGSPVGPEMPADEAPASEDPVKGEDVFDDSWEDRTLCIDESCIGVIGPDGRCKECKKPYPG